MPDVNNIGYRIAKEFINIGNVKIDQIDGRVRELLTEMKETSKNLKLSKEVDLVLDKALKEKVLDFSQNVEFSTSIDEMHRLGILTEEKKYTFTKDEILTLKQKVDNYEKDCEMRNQQSTLLIQPNLQLMKQIIDILFEAMKDENSLIDHALQRIV